jgi:transcriptional regulator with XRE-family HTH domain
MKLKEYLEKRGIKHLEFARKCGLKKSAFSRYLNGSRIPSPLTAMRIREESKKLVTEFDSIIDDHLDLIRKSCSI